MKFREEAGFQKPLFSFNADHVQSKIHVGLIVWRLSLRAI